MIRRSLILEAANYNLPSCPKCRAARGNPCRKPSGHTTTPHTERMQEHAREVDKEIEETYGRDA